MICRLLVVIEMFFAEREELVLSQLYFEFQSVMSVKYISPSCFPPRKVT